MNVVIISNWDYAGSGQRIAEAVDRMNPEINIRCITKHKTRFGHKTGLILGKDTFAEAKELITSADIIHFKGDDLPEPCWGEIDLPDVPWVITLGGSGFRRGNSTIAREWHPIEDYVRLTSLRTTTTPDLNYPKLDGIYTPLPIDSTAQSFAFRVGSCPSCGAKTPFRVLHIPSSREKKGTDTIIRAIERVERKEIPFTFELIENCTHKESVNKKQTASIYIDNVTDMGAFCNAALEAMQFGVPTIAYISEASIKQAGGQLDDLPIINCKTRLDICSAITYYSKNHYELRELAKKTKAYVDKYHSYEAVGKRWGELYDGVVKDHVVPPPVIKKTRSTVVDVTVALPTWGNKDILWLPMEGLCRQQTARWELIILECRSNNEAGEAFFMKYWERLKTAGCRKITYIYSPIQLPLSIKWLRMADIARGEVFSLQGSDDYPHNKRISIVAGMDHLWYDCANSYQYHINLDKMLTYASYHHPIRGWITGFDMSANTRALKKIAKEKVYKGVDYFLFKNIFGEDTPDHPGRHIDHTLYNGLPTTGYNTISKKRDCFFTNPKKPFYPSDVTPHDIIPKDIADKLLAHKKHHLDYDTDIYLSNGK